ncbi:MAG TPA: nuclear transport factor 2 family protein [Stellaceae bacterium]|nr:nuclear transport factor 2 family protein [Stellaceae bacterium]
MNIDRRHLAIAGAVALSAASLLRDTPATAASADETAVGEAVENLRKASLAADKAKLTALADDKITYGHSDGRVQDKAQMLEGFATRKAVVKSIDFPELKIAVSGDTAVTRHLYVSESELDGKTTNIKIGVIECWHKEGGGWKLLGRQGFKIG